MGYFTELLNRIGTSFKEVGSGLSEVYKPDLKETAQKVKQATDLPPYSIAKDVFIKAPARALGSIIKTTNPDKNINYTPTTEFEKLVLGTEPIKDIGTRTQETQQFINEKAPILSRGSKPLAFLGVIGMTALDLSPFGGEKNALKSITKVSKLEDAIRIGEKLGVAEEDMYKFAKSAVATKTESEAKTLLDSVAKISPEAEKGAKILSGSENNIYQQKDYYTNVYSGKGWENTFQKVENAKSVPNDYGLDLFVSKNKDGLWVVSEGKSGMALSDGFSTKNKAIEAMNENLKNTQTKGLDVKKVIDDNISQYGLSPRYDVKKIKKSSQEVVPTLQKTEQSIKESQKSGEAIKTGEVLPQVSKIPTAQEIDKSVSSVSNDITTLSKSKGVNVNNLKISQEGKNIINQTAEEIRPLVEQKVGKTLTNQQVVDLAGQTSAQLKKIVDQKQTLEWEAALLRTRQKLAKAAETGKIDEDFIKNYMTVKTVGTDIARKLQSLSIKADPESFNIGTILDAIIKQTDNAEEIINAAKGVDFNDFKQATEFYRKFVSPKATEWIDLLRYNSMLSSPNTHLINTFSNLLNTTMIAPIEKALTGGLDFLGSKLTGKGRQYFAGEALKFVEGYFKSIKQATTDFADVMRGKNPITQLDIRQIPLATRGKAKVIESVLNYPLRLLEASDRFFMRLTESGELAGLEYRASKGVPIKLAESKATEVAKYRLYRQGLKPENQGLVLDAVDSFTQMIEGLRNNKNPIVSQVSKWTVPFVRTPMNILKQGIEYSPAGFSTIVGAKNKTEQLSKAIIGSVIATGAAMLAFSDRLTFGEPTGATEKQAFRQAGRQAYSIKIGDKWVSYQKLPPAMAFSFAITAGLKDAYDNKKIDDNVLDLTLSSLAKVGGFFSDQSYVKTIGDAISSIQGGEAGIQRLMSDYPLQLIPYRALSSWFARLIDASQRKIDSDAGFIGKEIQTLMTSFPFLSQQVPARLDKDGTPIPNFNRFWNAFSPLKVQTENKKMEEFFQQREDFYKKVAEDNNKSAELKKKVKPIYDKVQKLKDDGKIDEAKKIVNGLSNEEYDAYKKIKSSDTSKNTTEGEIKLLPVYQNVQKLVKDGKIDEAKSIVNALSDDDYKIYQKLKNRFK